MKYELVATATFGLEAVVRREIEALGFSVVKTEDGRVTYTFPEEIEEGDDRGNGDSQEALVRAIARSNLWLRSADRVYIKMAEFDAKTFEELYQGVRGIDWEKLIPLDGEIVVVGTSVKSTLHSVPACQSIIKKAIVDRLLLAYKKENEGSLSETGAMYRVRFAFLKDRVLILMDSSGEGLHKRGYRIANVDAPIKETLAAALIELSFWKAGRILIDPCCGSGTIGIEAALIGMNIAPGLSRKFVSEDWVGEANGNWKEIWKVERKAAYSAIDYDTELDITCGDISPKAIAAAKENAEAAGVDDQITFVEGDMAALKMDNGMTPTEGIIICNPPYGERIGEKREIEHIYDVLGRFYKENPTWSLFMITSDKDAETKAMGRPANRRRKLYNGMIETTYYQFHGERPKNQKRE